MLDCYENPNLGIAGCMVREGQEVIIYSNPETGDFIYWDETSGSNMLLGGLTDRTAKQEMNKDLLFSALSKGSYGADAMGVIFCDKHVIVITSEASFELRPYNALKVPSEQQFDLQLDIDAEE